MVGFVNKNTSRADLRDFLKAKKWSRGKGFDAKRFNGALKVEGDPVQVQLKLRDEWG